MHNTQSKMAMIKIIIIINKIFIFQTSGSIMSFERNEHKCLGIKQGASVCVYAVD